MWNLTHSHFVIGGEIAAAHIISLDEKGKCWNVFWLNTDNNNSKASDAVVCLKSAYRCISRKFHFLAFRKAFLFLFDNFDEQGEGDYFDLS